MEGIFSSLLIISVLFGSVDEGTASCTFPATLEGDWESATKGNLTFNSTHLSGYEITASSSLTFECHINSGDYYVFRSDSFTVIGSANVVNAVFCAKFSYVSAYSYIYYEVTNILPNTVDERIQYIVASQNDVTLSDVCNDTSTESVPQNVKVLVRYGNATNAKQQCPDVILGQYWYYDYSTCNASFWDVCSDLTTMTFNYSLCSTQMAYSANGTVYCVYSLTSSGTTVVYVYNDDDTVDGSTTYRFTCMVMTQSSSLVYVSQSPNDCYSNQTSTYEPSTGLTMTLSPNITCVPTTTLSVTMTTVATKAQVAESNAGVIAGVTVVLLAVIAGVAVLGFLIYTKKLKKVDPSQTQPVPKEKDKSSLSLNVYPEDDTRDTLTPSVIKVNATHGKSADDFAEETEGSLPPEGSEMGQMSETGSGIIRGGQVNAFLEPSIESNRLPSLGDNTPRIEPATNTKPKPLPPISSE